MEGGSVTHHASGLRVERLTDVTAFRSRAHVFLERHETEHILPLGIAASIEAAPELYADGQPSFTVVTDAGKVVAASLRTPPWNEVLSTGTATAVDALAQALAGEDLRGVTGPTAEAARFAERWSALTGQPARLEIAERTYRLERVIPPSRPSGRWRFVEAGDRATIARWLVAFHEEAVPDSPAFADPLATADRWVSGLSRIGYAWEDDGEMVALLGAGGPTPNGIRIGPVYTPPDRRRRGYASALTAAAAQDQLDRGRRFVFLFTDLANPTSNHIYQAVGFEPICDVDQYRFEPGEQADNGATIRA
jgi:predicted GNAT family acetyltransferase